MLVLDAGAEHRAPKLRARRAVVKCADGRTDGRTAGRPDGGARTAEEASSAARVAAMPGASAMPRRAQSSYRAQAPEPTPCAARSRDGAAIRPQLRCIRAAIGPRAGADGRRGAELGWDGGRGTGD